MKTHPIARYLQLIAAVYLMTCVYVYAETKNVGLGGQISCIVQKIKSPGENLVHSYSTELFELGPLAIPHIIELTKDSDKEVRRYAVSALARFKLHPTKFIQDQGIIEAILERLDDEDLNVRYCAWGALSGFQFEVLSSKWMQAKILSGLCKFAERREEGSSNAIYADRPPWE